MDTAQPKQNRAESKKLCPNCAGEIGTDCDGCAVTEADLVFAPERKKVRAA
jgi:hypothetical protein